MSWHSGRVGEAIGHTIVGGLIALYGAAIGYILVMAVDVCFFGGRLVLQHLIAR